MGFYFANPRNRFWKAFNQANIINQVIQPDDKIHHRLIEEFSIGFTDVVKRPSSMGHELRAEDFKRDVPKLRSHIEKYRPQIVWFHGKVAFSKFMQYGYAMKSDWLWGNNQIEEINARVYVSPNPSPANAAFSLDCLVDYYKKLKLI